MNTNDMAVERLRYDVEQRYGHQITGPHDFNELSDEIAAVTDERLSVSTLKRLWDYVKGYNTVRLATLGVLARYVGCRDWAEFCDTLTAEDTSGWHYAPVIPISTLKQGDRIEVTWHPGRRIVVQYMEQGRFRVLECERCKLAVDDTFSCIGMVCGEQLVLTQVQRIGSDCVKTYVCGKKGGIQARKL
ncbi:MAG: hypothetical protein J6S96_03530 [Muribaculaceae bacterium]|nr:hypothetical protein [Muribaculaceae bacterium]